MPSHRAVTVAALVAIVATGRAKKCFELRRTGERLGLMPPFSSDGFAIMRATQASNCVVFGTTPHAA